MQLPRMRRAIFLLALAPLLALGGAPVNIYIAGDSTAAEKLAEKRPETGWGEMLAWQFRPGTVRILNHARNGRSTRTFISEGRWQAIVDSLRPGDYVLIQFGHNDESVQKTDRYTPPADFRSNLVRFVADVRAKQATPVLLTPVSRRTFDSTGVLRDTHGEYPDIVRAVAAEQHAALIDMLKWTQLALSSYGVERSKTLFLQLPAGVNANYPQGVADNTHFNPVGAAVVARLFAEALRGSDLPLRELLRD